MSKHPRVGPLALAGILAATAGLPQSLLIQPRKIKEHRMPLTEAELEKLRSFDTRAEDRKVRSQEKRARKAYVRELESKYAAYIRARVLGLPLPVYATEGSEHSESVDRGEELAGA